MDFYKIETREGKKGRIDVFPNFQIEQSKDLMVRGGQFYAIWDEEQGLWSTNSYDVPRLVDEDLRNWAIEKGPELGAELNLKTLTSFDSGSWTKFNNFCKGIADHSHQLDQTITFKNTEVRRNDYVSKRLPYSLAPGDIGAWDELVGTLYSVEERAKIEWAIGAVVSGDAKKIQKFLVFYGGPGTGKSTILNIVEMLFQSYTTTFDAKALVGTKNSFATEAFRHDPLVAIQHDGDLSRINDNSMLNSIVSHEHMLMNEKFKAQYTARVNAFLFMGTNQPVHISDAKSGIIRRLIDVQPTGVIIPNNHYTMLMSQIEFELGAIAYHCLEVYRSMGKNYYSTYRAKEMMLQTDVFFNFVEAYYDIFQSQDGTTLKQAYSLYKEFCDETGIERRRPQYKVREELRNYFDSFLERAEFMGHRTSSVYLGFNADKFKAPADDSKSYSLVLDETESIFDEQFASQPAQLASKAGTPRKAWATVTTTLADVDTGALHFVRVPREHIVIDFDLKAINGTTALERNLEAASNWPPTYAEVSKSGEGVHLHYNFEGEVEELSSYYSDGIEVKTLLGEASLRRKLTHCNDVPIATINSGLPFKEKKVLKADTIKSEKGLRDLIARNLRKEIHPGTKPSIDFIKHILDEAYESGMEYDVSDLLPKFIAFANNSTNQPLQSLKIVQQMKLKSEHSESMKDYEGDDRIAFFDLEVFPNLFVVCWGFEDSDEEVKMINPTPQEMEHLFKLKLVGYNNRRYDNHIAYARYLGYDNMALYKLSQKIVNNSGPGVLFGEAYKLSYADIFDFSSEKKTLKKFQIELGLPHHELGLPWDEPVPEELWPKVVEYCCSDLRTTKEVFKARKADFVARQILAELSGLTVNDTTQKHTAKIIFGNDRMPQQKFKYTDLSKEFEGYEFDMGKSYYRGELVGEGGYVYAEPGMYENVAVLDVASMHPSSIIQLNMFGDEYTAKFAALRDARIAIKSGDYDGARQMFGGRLSPYLEDDKDAKKLSYALKIAINIVYGLTSAKFDNPFRDIRNKDNIAAKRGALFMIDLKNACQEKGLQVVHIKTDSIKIPGATQEDIDEIMAFGAKYGYEFEHETTYDKMCLVNDAVYVARDGDHWEAVGAQFQHPYVYKSLFSGEEIEFRDLCETKQVQKGAMYLDFEHDKPMALVEGMQFVGKSALVVPVKEGNGGGVLYRVDSEKVHAVTGTKNHLWMEADTLEQLGERAVDVVDMSYYDRLVAEAVKTINKFGDFEEFVK